MADHTTGQVDAPGKTNPARPVRPPRLATGSRSASFPLGNRGPQALQQLLYGHEDEAHDQVRLLTLSELVHLAEAAERLAELATPYIVSTCTVCTIDVFWYVDQTGQSRGWRHADQAASYCVGAHRASPARQPAAGEAADAVAEQVAILGNCQVTIDGATYTADLEVESDRYGRYVWKLQAYTNLSHLLRQLVDVEIRTGSKFRHGKAYVSHIDLTDPDLSPGPITRFVSAGPLEEQ